MSLRQTGTEKVTALVNAITGLITSHNNNSNAHSTEMAKKVNNTDSRLSDKREPVVVVIDGSSPDLNSYKEAGFYYIPFDVISNTSNLPVNSQGYSHALLFVESNNDEGIGINVKQTISYDGESYVRYFFANTWSDWFNVRTPNTHNHTKSEITDFPSTMTPTSHTHGNLTNDGKIGNLGGRPIITTTGGKLTAGSFGTSGGTFCQGNDSRLSNARTPTAHTHTKSQITDFGHEHGYDEDVFTTIDINNNESEYLQLNSATGMGLYAKWNGAFNIPTANTWVDVKDLNNILHNGTGDSDWNIEVLGTSWSSNINYGVQGIFFLRAKRTKISAYCNVTGEVNHTSFTIPFFYRWVENDTI